MTGNAAVRTSVVALAMMTLAAVSPAGAQGRDRVPPPVSGRTIFEGLGSEIGVSVRDLGVEEIASAKLDRAGGVVVQEVREGGPAARAGVRSGDVVVEFDGERVRGARHFSRLMRETPAGRPAKSTLVRDGARRNVDIVPEPASLPSLSDLGPAIERGLRAFPREFWLDAPRGLSMPRMSRGRLGVSVSPLTDQLAAYFGVRSGVLVSSVEPGSPASDAGIRAGDVIVTVDGHAVGTVADLTREVLDAQSGAALDVRLSRDKREIAVTVTVPAAAEDRPGGDSVPPV